MQICHARYLLVIGIVLLLTIIPKIDGQVPCDGNTRTCYNQDQLPSYLQTYIYRIQFDNANGKGTGVQLYLNDLDYRILDIAGAVSGQIGSFIVTRPQWKGDRTSEEVSNEINAHFLAATFGAGSSNRVNAVNPVHIEYYKNDLQIWEKSLYPIAGGITGYTSKFFESILNLIENLQYRSI